MARKPRKFPYYFILEEASALVVAAPSCEVWMVMRIMLWAGLQVSSACPSVRRTSGSTKTLRS